MTQPDGATGRHPARRATRFTATPVAAACSTLMMCAAPALAEDAAGTEASQTVVITGVRHAIESSVKVKRNSDSIVEAVSSEDIGKLPDVSIAESLARLPGITAQRVDGRAQVLSIRGLSPNYSGTLLNGREIVSTGDNRAAEYDQFPSELLSGAVIYKTPDAALIGQGLSGTADMLTVRPLDFRGRQVVFNVRGEKNSNGKLTPGASDTGGRFSASYIDQFADRTVGVALGLAHLDSPGQEKHYKSWWWANTGNWGRPVQGAPEGAITLNGFEATVTSSQQKRDGLMGVVEWKPNKDFHSVADLYYSKFDQKRTMRGIMSNLGPTWNDSTEPVYADPVVTTVNGDPIVTGGTISNLKPVIRNDYNTRKDEIVALGWKNELKLGDWLGVADLSYSRADRREQILESYAGNLAPGSFAIDVATGGGVSQFVPSQDYADAASVLLSDPAGWGHDGLIKYPKVQDELKSLRLSAARDLTGIFSRVEAGINYSDRTKDVNKTEVALNLKNDRSPVSVGSEFLLSPTSLGFAGVPSVLSYDIMGVLGTAYDLSPTGQDQAFARQYDIAEKLTTAYVKASIDTEVFGIPMRGNIGVQVVQTDQHSNGFAWDGATSVPIEGGKSYTDVLPSVNLAFEVANGAYVRFGLAQTMARPRMEDMRAGFSSIGVSTETRKWSASGGNPWLEPWRADAIDLSFEKYFGKASYVSAAIFHKELRNFIYNKTISYDFTGFPNNSGVTPISNIGDLTAPANGSGGMVAGVELTASIEGSLLTPMLDGFGAIASHSHTRSSLHEENDVSEPLDGLSGDVASLTLYYEKYGFSARVAERFRSPFETKTRGVFLDNVTSKIEAERQIDMQLGYAFETGSLKGLSLLFQVNNMTDEPYRTRKGIDSGSVTPGATLPERYTTYGRQYLFGLNYKL
jgi:iron complex outermembrane receptor protein